MKIAGFVKARAVLLLPMVLLAIGATSDARRLGDDTQRVLVLLEQITVAEPCGFNCELTSCPGTEHKLAENELGNDTDVDGVGAHPCFEVDGGCEVHGCQPELAATINQLPPLLRQMNGDQILLLARTQPERLVVNLNRKALQVVGCDGQVSLSLNMTAQQFDEVASGL